MPRKRSFIAQVVGTGTKARMLEHFYLDQTPVTRARLARAIGSGLGPTYGQVDELVALGVFCETGGKVGPDTSFPFFESLANFVVLSADYMRDLRVLLERVDALFNDGYYITGYLAARRYGPPVDRDQDTALVAVLDLDGHGKNYLGALSRAAVTELDWLGVGAIPDDVARIDIYGAKVWLASAERGLVDSVVMDDADMYTVVQLFMRDVMAGSLDWGRLRTIAGEAGVLQPFLSMAYALNKRAGRDLAPLKRGEAGPARSGLDPLLSKAVKDAYNTLMEG